MDGVVVVNPSAVCVLMYGLYECLDPLSRLEGLVWVLYCMYIDMAALQCKQIYLQSVCDHPIDDCLVYARKIAWSMGSLTEGMDNGHCMSGLPSCHDLIPCSRVSYMGLGVLNVNLSVALSVHHCVAAILHALSNLYCESYANKGPHVFILLYYA